MFKSSLECMKSVSDEIAMQLKSAVAKHLFRARSRDVEATLLEKSIMMNLNRRQFLKSTAAAGAALASAKVSGEVNPESERNGFGMLYDSVRCIGCRSCEAACNEVNKLPKPVVPFDDDSVFRQKRSTTPEALTVVNRYANPNGNDPIHRKQQCMHCNDAACVSACLVDALNKTAEGAVEWDNWKCIGCRYCMLACPFQMLKFEFKNALNPHISKCTFCIERLRAGGKPGCFEACPAEAIAFGKRSDLLIEARQRIADNPGLYVNHIYGEKEVGGTAKLYLTGVPAEKLDLPKLKEKAIPKLTESIQHGVFKYFLPPLGLFALLAGAMALFKRKDKDEASDKERNNG